MNDHDLLITIHTIVDGLKKTLDSVTSDVKQKADKTDVAALSARVDVHDKRIEKIEDLNRDNATRKNERQGIKDWSWGMWAKFVGVVGFLMMLWQVFQSTTNNSKQPIIVQIDPTTFTSSTFKK